MKKGVILERVSDKEMNRLISSYTGLSMRDVEIVRRAETMFIKKLLIAGHEINMYDVGMFTSKYRQAQKETIKKFRKLTKIDAQPAHYRPKFKFKPAFMADMKEQTAEVWADDYLEYTGVSDENESDI